MNPQPQFIGKYQLLKKIATGGMAEVWFARQSGIEGFRKEVVVKRILPHLADDPEFIRMFLNEAKMVARFSHPNVAQIFEFGRDEVTGSYFIAMEYVRGEDLGQVMRQAYDRNQWISQALAIRVVAACCDGLHYAHSQNDDQGRPMKVVHRDISPQNILVSFDGSVKLVDFGIAKAANQQNHTQAGAIKGKFVYMSPEQAAGKPLDNRSDLFALGLVLYELLTNRRPLKRDGDIATLSAALDCKIDPPSAVAEIPAELDDVVMRALARNPEDRYPDARAFQMALEELLLEMRWVATSVQLSELMRLLFPGREEQDRKLAALGQDIEDEPAQGVQAPSRESVQPAPSGKHSAPRNTGSQQVRGAQPSEAWNAPPGSPPTGSGLRRRVSGPSVPQRERTPSRTGARPTAHPGPPAPEGMGDEDAPAAIKLVRRTTTTSQAGRRTSAGQLQPLRRTTGGRGGDPGEDTPPPVRRNSGAGPALRPPARTDTPPTMDMPAGGGLPELAAGAGFLRAGLPRAGLGPAPRKGLALAAVRAIQAAVLLSLFAMGAAAAWRYRKVLKDHGEQLAARVGQALTVSVALDVNLDVDVSVRHPAKAGAARADARARAHRAAHRGCSGVG